jgi:hypothetical protein
LEFFADEAVAVGMGPGMKEVTVDVNCDSLAFHNKIID